MIYSYDKGSLFKLWRNFQKSIFSTSYFQSFCQGFSCKAERLENAKKMLAKGLDISLIAEITELSVEELQKL